MQFYKNNFKKIRISRGYTQEEIGKLLGIRKQAVQLWEKGKSQPRSKKVIEIAKIFNVSVVDISDMMPEKELIKSLEKFEKNAVHETQAAYGSESQIKKPSCPLTDEECPFNEDSILRTLVKEIIKLNDEKDYAALLAQVTELKHKKNKGTVTGDPGELQDERAV